MEGTKIEINGKSFILQFGMKFFRLLSQKWNLPGIQSVIQKLAILETITEDISFEQMDVLNDLILSAIAVNPENTNEISRDELDEMYLQNTTEIAIVLQTVTAGLIASLPKPEASGKPKAAKPQRVKPAFQKK